MKPTMDEIREMIALDLYGELDAAQRAILEQALAGSPEAREYADRMRRTLGPLASEAGRPQPGDLPDGWKDRLRVSIGRVESPQRTRLPRSWAPVSAASAIGFAAGLLLMWVLLGRSEPAPTQKDSRAEAPVVATGTSGADSFERSTAPPPARDPGTLARLGSYLGR